MQRKGLRMRSAFTIVELLVSIAIIGVLAALLLPAIQQSRESARVTLCKNNLKQIALATINFHDTKEAFPPGRIAMRPGDPAELSCGQDTPSWLVRILPYLEQDNFADQWDLYEPFQDHPEEVRNHTIPIYFCPTRRSSVGAISPACTVEFTAACGCSGPQTFESGSTGDYSGNHGDMSAGARGYVEDFYWGGNGNGVIVSSRAYCVQGKPREWIDKVRMRDVTDGLSNTILTGETHINRNRINTVPDDGLIYNGWHIFFSMRIGGKHVPIAPNMDYVDTRLYGFGSWHKGICQFGLCDGSVRAISTSIDEDVLGRLCVRNDGQVVGEF